jgi:hypothetical protein
LPFYCNNHETEISLNAPIYNCTGGCPVIDPCDPLSQPDCLYQSIDCIKKYECMDVEDYLSWCEYDPILERKRCVAYLVGWTCYECEPNPDKVNIGWTLSGRCIR